jgi:hypothetical protein
VLRFIGLFDTVVQSVVAAPTNSRSLPCQWHRCRVVQLTARDEHRQHHPLTSVAPPFTEIALPGVHANIGGLQPAGGRPQAAQPSTPAAAAAPRRCRLPDSPLAMLQRPPPTLKRRPMPSAGGSSWAWTKESVGGCLAPVAAAAPRRQPQRAVVPGAVRDAAVVLRRRIDWRYQLIALQVMQQHAIDAGVTWRASAAEIPGWELPSALQPIARRLVAGRR